MFLYWSWLKLWFCGLLIVSFDFGWFGNFGVVALWMCRCLVLLVGYFLVFGCFEFVAVVIWYCLLDCLLDYLFAWRCFCFSMLNCLGIYGFGWFCLLGLHTFEFGVVELFIWFAWFFWFVFCDFCLLAGFRFSVCLLFMLFC